MASADNITQKELLAHDVIIINALAMFNADVLCVLCYVL